MLDNILNVLRVIFALTVIVGGAAFGAASGFDSFGWLGALGYGVLGVGLGTVVGVWPSLLFEILPLL